MRLLLVDDDEQYLRALERCIRRERPSWDIRTATSVRNAQDFAKYVRVDALISDLEMPDEDGDVLLRVFADTMPTVFRVLHSGNRAAGHELEELGACHRFVPKPFKTETLLASLRVATEMSLLSEKEELRALLLCLRFLPREPKLALEIDTLLRSEDFHQHALVQRLERDPAITAYLLRAANSAAFFANTPVHSVERAVFRLGVATVRNLVLGAELFSSCTVAKTQPKLLADLWDHSLEVASLADSLSNELALSPLMREASFTAGILHDVGKLLLLELSGDSYADALRELSSSDLLEFEQQHYGIHHAELGGAITRLWNLPFSITEAITCHHDVLRRRGANPLRPLSCLAMAEREIETGTSEFDATARIARLKEALDLLRR